jgi:ribonucleoside-triphosphate reductase
MTSTTLPTDYQNFIALSRYARFRDDLSRRETWDETVRRYVDFWQGKISQAEADTIYNAICNLEVMPSMRALMTAGPALDRDHVAGYNCAYTAIKAGGKELHFKHPELDDEITVRVSNPICWDEVFYILLCGTGVGFSVERQYVGQLPKVGKKLSRKACKPTEKNYPGVPKGELSVLDEATNTIDVKDSKYGWASALRVLVFELYNGNYEVKWDVSAIRPSGARLKTFGGRASGPKPLEGLFDYAVKLFSSAAGRKLSSLECHDFTCAIADVVVVGGVRRAALISLSNLTDDRMRTAKSGAWWEHDKQRALANNSVCYTEKPTTLSFLKEWTALYGVRLQPLCGDITSRRAILQPVRGGSPGERHAGRPDSQSAYRSHHRHLASYAYRLKVPQPEMEGQLRGGAATRSILDWDNGPHGSEWTVQGVHPNRVARRNEAGRRRH